MRCSVHLPSTAEIDDYLGLWGGLFEKVTKSDIDDMEAEVVAPVDQRGSALGLVDEEAEEMRLIWVVQTLNASLGHDAAVVGGHNEVVVSRRRRRCMTVRPRSSHMFSLDAHLGSEH